MLRRTTIALAAAAFPVLTAMSVPVLAAQDTRPATQPGVSERLQATITGVEGMVQVRNAEDQPWQRCAVGMVLDEGAEFRTGPRSAVRFTLPPEQVCTLDRLGTVKLLEAVRTGTRTRTDLGMQYGRVRYDIEAAGQEHDSTIHTPGSTLAVRGTKVGVESTAAFPTQVYSLEGRAFFANDKGQSGYFGGASGTSTISADVGTPAGTAYVQTFVDPSVAGARSPQETEALNSLTSAASPSSNAAMPLSDTTMMPPVDMTPPPPTGVPGSLVFQLVWIQSSTQKGTVTPDLDLFVFTPSGEQLCPKDCPPLVPSGGRSPSDDQGGQKLRFGEEVAVFPEQFPPGNYRYEVRHVSGESAEYQIAVLQNGELIGKPVNGTVDAKENRATFKTTFTSKSNPPTTPTKPTALARAKTLRQAAVKAPVRPTVKQPGKDSGKKRRS